MKKLLALVLQFGFSLVAQAEPKKRVVWPEKFCSELAQIAGQISTTSYGVISREQAYIKYSNQDKDIEYALKRAIDEVYSIWRDDKNYAIKYIYSSCKSGGYDIYK